MKLRHAAAYRYKTLAPFLAAVVVFSIIQYVFTKPYKETTEVDAWLSMAKCVFFFVFGIMSFKRPYKYLLQNGYKNAGIYESFLLSLPSTFIVSLIINVASYLIKSQNDYFTWIFSQGDFDIAQSDMKVFLIYKIIVCTSVFALSMIAGYLFAVIFYRLDKKVMTFLMILACAAAVAVLVLLTYFGSDIGLISPIFTPAFTMLTIPLAVLLASLGYFLSERISLERSRS